jgi:hypothetical protein
MSRMVRLVTIIGIMVLSLVLAMACGGAPAPAPSPSPAPKPAASPTPAPAAAPSPAPAGGGAFPLDVTPVLDGHAQGPTKVTVTTVPGAVCTIKVVNPKTGTVSAYPTEKTKTADASGKVVWEWTIPRQVAKGDGTIEVTATKDGQTVTKTVVYRITVSDY